MEETEGSVKRAVCCLLYADDAVLIFDCDECLQRLVNGMGVVIGMRMLIVNMNKSKVMKVSRRPGEHGALNVH